MQFFNLLLASQFHSGAQLQWLDIIRVVRIRVGDEDSPSRSRAPGKSKTLEGVRAARHAKPIEWTALNAAASCNK